jgi:hypothetical protein
MAFDRLQKLGDAKWQKIVNELSRGTSAMAVARLIQIEWHDFSDVAEKTLTQQINRLNLAIKAGQIGEDPGQKGVVVQSIAAGLPEPPSKPRGKPMVIGSYSCADKLVGLCVLAEERVMRLIEKEKALPMPLNSLNEVMRDYAEFLLKLQKVRFDLGIDEFRGPTGQIRGTGMSVTLPDGTNVQRQVYEALGAAEEIFAKHQIEA